MAPLFLRNKTSFLALVAAFFIVISGCQKNLGSYLERAHKTFDEKNYVDTIDIINAGISSWQKSEGIEKKAEAYELLGKSHRALRNPDKALEAYQQAAKLVDNRFDVYFDMASIYLTKNFADQAERNYREALRVKPNEPLALLGLGNSLFAQRKTAEAAETFQRIIDTSPGVRDAMESLAALRKPAKAAVVKKAPAKPAPTKAKSKPAKHQRGKRR